MTIIMFGDSFLKISYFDQFFCYYFVAFEPDVPLGPLCAFSLVTSPTTREDNRYDIK